MTPSKECIKWIEQAVKEHESFTRVFRTAKEHALNAGFYLLSARSKVDDGAWGELLLGYDHKMKARTARGYMQFASEAIEWVKAENPKLVGMPAIMNFAHSLVMQSPKGFVALLRELGQMRKFGEYDSVKYAIRKRNGEQIEFDFSLSLKALDPLDHLGEPNFILKCPEGKTELEALGELKTRLESVLVKVSAQMQPTKITDIN